MSQDRIKKVVSKATSINTAPSRSKLAQILEMITGVPTDPEWYKNASREEIFMNTVPQIAPILIGGAASAGRTLKSIPDATKGIIKKDPFGLSDAPIERRQFLDKMVGNTTKRGQEEVNKKFAAPEYLTTDEGFENAANFAQGFNNKFGWPNAVVNPEAIGTWRDPKAAEKGIGPLMKLYEMLKGRVP